jgi:hypothetical protein
MKSLIVLLLLLVPAFAAPRQVATAWWRDWRFGTTTHIYLHGPTMAGDTLVLTGISDGECMQDAADDSRQHFTKSHQYRSPDGNQCEERWCLNSIESTKSVRVWGSAIGPIIKHSAAVTVWPAGAVSCP